jgi:hypothetical protein
MLGKLFEDTPRSGRPAGHAPRRVLLLPLLLLLMLPAVAAECHTVHILLA